MAVLKQLNIFGQSPPKSNLSQLPIPDNQQVRDLIDLLTLRGNMARLFSSVYTPPINLHHSTMTTISSMIGGRKIAVPA